MLDQLAMVYLIINFGEAELILLEKLCGISWRSCVGSFGEAGLDQLAKLCYIS